MLLTAYPEENPLIEGVLNRYAIGDLVSGNCTSSLSYPQPLMTWYVNGIQVSPCIIFRKYNNLSTY